MKTTGFILAAVAATAAAENFVFNVREAETDHIHAEFGDLGYRCAQTANESAEVSFYQVSTGESLFQLSTTETAHNIQYLDNAPVTVKNQGGTNKESFTEMKASGSMQARITGHEALHAHPIFAKFIAPLSRALGENGMQGNTHPAAVYLHTTAMAVTKRHANQGAHSLRKAGEQAVPSNLNSMTKGDAFEFDSTSESFIQEIAAGEEEWGVIAGAVNGIINGITGMVNGIIGGITTLWDNYTDFVSTIWNKVCLVMSALPFLSNLVGILPVGDIATAIYWEVIGGGRRRRRRRYHLYAVAEQYRPFFDNKNFMWSRVARCMDGMAMPSGMPGTPCFGICGPGCYCFIWHCGSCLRFFRACWEHDCACTKDCVQTDPDGLYHAGTVAWEAYICWMFTANLSTCATPACCATWCGKGHNGNNDHMTEMNFDDGDCHLMARTIQQTSRVGAQYFVVGVNFPKRGPGGMGCFELGTMGQPIDPNPTPQNAGYGGGGFTVPSDGQATMCYTSLGKTAMMGTLIEGSANGAIDTSVYYKHQQVKQGEINGWKPYGDWFSPTAADFAALGYNNPNALHDKLNSPVGYPGCGIDASRLSLKFRDAVEAYGAAAWNTRVGNNRQRMFTRGGTINYRAANIGQYPPTHALGTGGQNGYEEGEQGTGCFGYGGVARNGVPHTANTTPPTRFPTEHAETTHNYVNPELISNGINPFFHVEGVDYIPGDGETGGNTPPPVNNGGNGCLLQLGESQGKFKVQKFAKVQKFEKEPKDGKPEKPESELQANQWLDGSKSSDSYGFDAC